MHLSKYQITNQPTAYLWSSHYTHTCTHTHAYAHTHTHTHTHILHARACAHTHTHIFSPQQTCESWDSHRWCRAQTAHRCILWAQSPGTPWSPPGSAARPPQVHSAEGGWSDSPSTTHQSSRPGWGAPCCGCSSSSIYAHAVKCAWYHRQQPNGCRHRPISPQCTIHSAHCRWGEEEERAEREECVSVGILSSYCYCRGYGSGCQIPQYEGQCTVT